MRLRRRWLVESCLDLGVDPILVAAGIGVLGASRMEAGRVVRPAVFFHGRKGAEMLVLSRRSGESIVIDGGIEIKVVRVKGGRVVVGVSAPSDVPVMRSELLERNAEDGRSNTARLLR